MVKIFLDAGHGGDDPGAVSWHLKEKDITLKIVKNIKAIIKSKALNVSIKMSRTKDTSVSLTRRIQRANNWNANLFLSIHINAGGGTGYEDYIHTSLSDHSKTTRIRQIIHKEVAKYHQLRNRGMKKANFKVLRETKMPAILTENGFIDHPMDQKLLQNDRWLRTLSKGYVNGLIKSLRLSTSPQRSKQNNSMYQVVAGSFLNRKNAQIRSKQLKQIGYDSTIDQRHINNQTYFRVITGSFTNKETAKRQKSHLKKAGFPSFITS